MAQNYAYKYAEIMDVTNGWCLAMHDSSNYVLRPTMVPIEGYGVVDYCLKYYWPLPETVTSFDDFQGLWYYDAEHTQLFDEGNAASV